jgi:hypothetical protein
MGKNNVNINKLIDFVYIEFAVYDEFADSN